MRYDADGGTDRSNHTVAPFSADSWTAEGAFVASSSCVMLRARSHVAAASRWGPRVSCAMRE
jgi:hypothetical protein